MKINKTMSFFPTVMQQLNTFYQNGKVVDGSLSFGSQLDNNFGTPSTNLDKGRNIQCYLASVNMPGTANTEFSITQTTPFFADAHVPIGYLVIGINLAAIIYVSGTPWTNKAVYLKSNVGGGSATIALI